MMIHPTEDSTTVHYSAKSNTTVSGQIGQHETITNSTVSKDNNTQQEDSSMVRDEQSSAGDICMVAQTSKCLQFHTARIQTISGNTVSFIYLSTKEKYIIHIPPFFRSNFVLPLLSSHSITN